jgi:hypothetical protein
MEPGKLSIRERFDQLRQAMRWSWKDVDEITGRKNTCSNIAKRVPAWSKLAIDVYESYETLLRRHLLEIITLRLGRNWESTMLSGGAVMFVGDEKTQSGELVWMELSFSPGEVFILGNTSQLHELAEQLSQLYPAIENVTAHEENYTVRIPIVFDSKAKKTQY